MLSRSFIIESFTLKGFGFIVHITKSTQNSKRHSITPFVALSLFKIESHTILKINYYLFKKQLFEVLKIDFISDCKPG